MGLFRRDQPDDDVDVESCLANLHRLDDLPSARVVDLRQPDHADVDLARSDRALRPRGAGLRAATPT